MLTAKEEKFCNNVVSGMTLSDAYKNSYNAKNMSDNTIYVKASELAKKDKIKVRIEELRKQLSDDSIMSAKERMKLLTEIASGSLKETDKVVTPTGKVVDIEKDTNLTTRMKALDILNKMSGEYITKVDATVDNDITINIELSDE